MHSLYTWLAGAVLFASSTAASAAIIMWGPAEDTTGPADVVTSGFLVEAFNATIAANVPGSVTINSVEFTNTSNLLGQAFVGALGGNSTTSGDASYDTLLNSFNFGGGTSTTIDIGGAGGLSIGSSYLVQVWYTDLRGTTRNMIFGDGAGNTVTLNQRGERLGQFAIGQFVADGGTQTLSLATNGFGFLNAHITGYQIRTNEPPPPLPEPATLLLMGGGLLGLGFAVTRRRRHAV